MEGLTVGAARRPHGLVGRECSATWRPQRARRPAAAAPAGYRVYGLAELQPAPHRSGSCATASASGSTSSPSRPGSRASPSCAPLVDGWLAAGADAGSWIDWEQRKQERLLAA